MHPFINKLLCFMLAIALVVALAVPVFAAADYPDPSAYLTSDHPSGLITFDETNNRYTLNVSATPFVKSNDGYKAYIGQPVSISYYYAAAGADKWTFGGSYTPNANARFVNVVWHTDDLIYDITYCDGTSCPATDADHNNICDDCGNVLAYNLRSTLLDFAKSTAESFGSGYPYYAVLEHPSKDSSYNLFISKSPMRADAPNYEVAIGESMQYTEVFTNDDGSFDRATWASVASFSGTLVYSNHTIENFQTPPLAAVIQGVTGEALEVEIPNLMAETKIIVLCGVGCLALLIALLLLSKKLKPFLTR